MSAQPQEGMPPLGTVLDGKYELVSLLGQGGMGAVYGARQLVLGRDCAVKVMLPELAVSLESRQRFEREARVTASLRHPNAIRVLDYGDDHGTLYLAMERLVGQPLRALVDDGLPLLPLDRVLRITHQVADCLVAAHDMELVHRDLKPDNVFLERDGVGADRAVVMDFGLAFIRKGDASVGRMTATGIAAGTPHYMSPEQCRGDRAIGPESDVYALGVMLYEMLTGEPPFVGGQANVLAAHLFVPPKPLRQRRPDVEYPVALERLVMRMLGKEPEDRPSTRSAREALQEIHPDPSVRERGRERTALVGREARMVSLAPTPDAAEAMTEAAVPSAKGIDERRVVLVLEAQPQQDLWAAMAMSGLDPLFSATVPDAPFHAVYAPSALPADVARLVAQTGKPVLVASDIGDRVRVAALIEAGASEVLVRPVEPGELVRKAWRVLRRRRAR